VEKRIEVRPIEQGTEDFDLEFWQAQGPSAIFQAAWDLVETAVKVKGLPDDALRLQRTVRVVRQA
jgi:hypothetical protein